MAVIVRCKTTFFFSHFFPKYPQNSSKSKIHLNEIDIWEDTKLSRFSNLSEMSRLDGGFPDSDSVTA